MERYIVVVGNPADGHFYYGPFDEAEEANAWAEQEDRANGTIAGDDWWVVNLNLP